MEKPENNNGKFIGALLVGAAIGGALGILFAPYKGSETRRKLAAKGGDLSDSIKDKFTDLTDLAKKESETIKTKAHNAVDHTAVKA